MIRKTESKTMTAPSTISLSAQYYRALPIDNPGHEPITFTLSLSQTALMGMHCWNIGCPDGPAIDVNYCVGMGWPQATQEAARIMSDVIRPSMDLARQVGMPVCHVETDWMSAHYPHIPTSKKEPESPNYSKEQQHILDRAHGKNYLPDSPLSNMKRAEIVSPKNEEKLFFYSDTLDTYLKAQNITTLIYTGFATDMCVLNAEGGANPMLARGYRCILMRDATVGVETPDTFPDRLATRYGTHLFEWKIGYSTTFADFQQALSTHTIK